ncbi:MAG: hypothetical protein JST00_03310 [Deltaproteobacteria bacterium]|nr:hypothetical protein [Deltaproteobacteria bacterium]
MTGLRTLAALVLVVAAFGCKRTPREGEGAATGLKNPANRREVVALAEAALACPWDDARGIDDAKCPAVGKWTKSPILLEPSSDATLLAMLADARPPVRWLAAKSLDAFERPARVDATSAARLLAAAEREPSAPVARALGLAVGAIDLGATALAPKVQAVLEGGARVELRAGIASSVVRRNPSFFPVVMKLARTATEPDLQSSSTWGLRFAAPEHQKEVQALWLERADSADPDVSDEVYTSCSVYLECEPIAATLLGKLEARKRMPLFVFAFLRVLISEPIHASLRTRAIELANRVVDDEAQEDGVRALTLDSLHRCGVPSAMVLARKYEGSSLLFLRERAKEILERGPLDGGADAGVIPSRAP